ncbi:MAG TPA: fumarylacetoacetate hydrolase family protein [Flavobacteriaceae bacterium]|nr:fumarylacetoacetate hydrolase family protein [Flavobacteriaceae bacterium]
MTPKEIAQTLRQAEKDKATCSPIRSYLNEKDLSTAYQIQKMNIDAKIEKGAKEVGKKIGLTSKKVQTQLGVDQPDFGILLDAMQIKNGSTVAFSEFMQPKAEAEIAFVLKEDLAQENITLANIVSAIDYALPAIEIVGSRIENWDIKITDTIADNASSSHFVLGKNPVDLKDIDLENCQMQLYLNNKKSSEGQGKDCLGNPLNAVLWLAQKMKALGNPLRKGEVILSGALGPMVPISEGDHIKATIEGLGEISFSVG